MRGTRKNVLEDGLELSDESVKLRIDPSLSETGSKPFLLQVKASRSTNSNIY